MNAFSVGLAVWGAAIAGLFAGDVVVDVDFSNSTRVFTDNRLGSFESVPPEGLDNDYS